MYNFKTSISFKKWQNIKHGTMKNIKKCKKDCAKNSRIVSRTLKSEVSGSFLTRFHQKCQELVQTQKFCDPVIGTVSKQDTAQRYMVNYQL